MQYENCKWTDVKDIILPEITPKIFYDNDEYPKLLNNNAYFWTTSSQDADAAWQRDFGIKHNGGIFRFYSDKLLGFSVRCVKN